MSEPPQSDLPAPETPSGTPPPETPPSALPPEPPPLAPWGVRETLAGILGTAALWIFAVVLATTIFGAAIPKSLFARYVLVIGAEVLLLVAPLLAAAVARGGAAALGLRRWPTRSMTSGALIGAGLWLVTFGYEKLLEWRAWKWHAQMLAEEKSQMEALAAPWPLLLLAALIIAPFAEEVFFRGFVFAGLRRRLGYPFASGLSAALFALVHVMPLSFVPLFFVGLGCAAAYERHHTLAAPLAVHVAFNGVALLAGALGAGP